MPPGQLQPVATHPTSWDPSVQPTLNVTLDACFVPQQRGGPIRLDMAHLVVLDNFIDENIRQSLLDTITAPGWDHLQGPPLDKWSRATQDTPDCARTWGLQHEALVALEQSTLQAKLEVQSRLAALYPEFTIAHQPSDAIQGTEAGSLDIEAQLPQQPTATVAPPPPPPHDPQYDHTAPTPDSLETARQIFQPAQGTGDAALSATHVIGKHGSPRHCLEPSQSGRRTPPRQSPPDAQQSLCSGSQAMDSSVHQPCPQASPSESSSSSRGVGEAAGAGPEEPCDVGSARYDCHAMLANAAVHGDEYGWHQDADPQTFPLSSPFVHQYGQYTNRVGSVSYCVCYISRAPAAGRQVLHAMVMSPHSHVFGEPGRPLFVSLLLYLNKEWPRDWAADTLFLDLPSDTGILVRPKTWFAVKRSPNLRLDVSVYVADAKVIGLSGQCAQPYRAVLMDQDVTHRLSAPSKAAGGHPRYSLVWKLVFLPKEPGQECCIARSEWGMPSHFGSAAKADAAVRQLARKRKQCA